MTRCSPVSVLECSVASARMDAVLDNMRRPRDPLRFENAAGEAVDILIYGQIIDDVMAEFFESGISAGGFVRQLQSFKGQALNVHINSPGGLVFGGLAIYNALRQHDAPVNVIVDGIAASIASVIAMAGDSVVMAPHAMMMIHEPMGMTVGNSADHKKMVEILGKEGEAIAAVYAERGDKRINWRQKMIDETWFSDQEAVSAGLADRIDTTIGPAQRNAFDLSHFNHVPTELAGMNSQAAPPTKRTIEKLLRDAGVKGDRAKAFISAGWAALEARDETEGESTPEEETTVETPVIETPPTGEATPSTAGTVVEDGEPEALSELAAQFARFQETKTIYRVEIPA